jgi:hypothetical protein
VNDGSLSNGEGAWVVIVNDGPTGNSAEFAETVFRRNTQELRTPNHATVALQDNCNLLMVLASPAGF